MTILNEQVLSFGNEQVLSFGDKFKLIFFLTIALLVIGVFYIDKSLAFKLESSMITLDSLLPSKN